jgi:pentapeptide repeat protein
MTVFADAGACVEPAGANDVCGAQAIDEGRCLAHMEAGRRGAYLATLSPGSDVHARGVVFTAGLLAELLAALRDEQNVVRIGIANFRDATFAAYAGFGEALFFGNAQFDGATFAGNADFRKARFHRYATFSGAAFSERATFDHTTFSGNAGFDRATFSRYAIFDWATFSEDARFAWARFHGTTDFVWVRFSGRATFHGATFSAPAQIVCCGDSIGFDRTTVEAKMKVEAAARTITALGMRARARVDLRVRGAQVDLADAAFGEPVTVHGLQQPIPNVDESALVDPQTGVVPPVAVTSLRGVDAESLALTDVDLSTCLFIGIHHAGGLRLNGRCTFATDPSGRRRVLAEEHHWRATRPSPRYAAYLRETRFARWGPAVGSWTLAPDGVDVVAPDRLEALYRQLRKALVDARDEPGSADFYYGEMEMRRAAAGRRGDRLLLWLYWAGSGYALRARRSLGWLAAVIAVGVIALTLFGFSAGPGEPGVALTLRAAEPVTSLPARIGQATEITLNAVVLRSVDTGLNAAGRYINLATRVLGPLLLGMSLLAIRNQVKR